VRELPRHWYALEVNLISPFAALGIIGTQSHVLSGRVTRSVVAQLPALLVAAWTDGLRAQDG